MPPTLTVMIWSGEPAQGFGAAAMWTMASCPSHAVRPTPSQMFACVSGRIDSAASMGAFAALCRTLVARCALP